MKITRLIFVTISRFVAVMVAILSLLLLNTLSATLAIAQTLPQYDDKLHLGVVTCAGSTCHGATRPFPNAPVLQNEYATWLHEDSHANAYEVLKNKTSQRIARNLGLKNAHTAEICLDCHADNVANERRGDRFHIEEGVTCEACHGGSSDWLGLHTSGKNTHQDNINSGLYPTEDPLARAKLCLSCHFGNDKKFVSHRIMGAGHPRMSFELDTFTAIQPAHYRVDQDYRERKNYWNGVQTWAIGQAVAVDVLMSNFLNERLHRNSGIFPELVFFDCFACHHSLHNLRWQPRASTQLNPGAVRLNDASLLMLQQIMQQVDPAIGSALRQATGQLHRASTRSMAAMQKVAEEILSLARQSQQILRNHQFDKNAMLALLNGLIQLGNNGDQRDYINAEQGVMAISAIVNSMDGAGLLSEQQRNNLTVALDKLYAPLADEDRYNPAQLMQALNSLKKAY